jgi:lipopolysaccharide transport system ATP-binding protein
MPAPVVCVESLSKRYLVGHSADRGAPYQYTALRDIVGRELRSAARKTADLVRGRQIVQGDEVEEFWALKDVSFEVGEGEVLGIIGKNGAGKSTLLKILSRITEPTAGRVQLRGRVASLLEVGTGFHPELTGRENIFLNGAILGMSRAEIRKKFDEIVAFAEVERFLDTPVKRYSSGMYVRLAFAVAAHLEPEILVIDEVLAVGDAEFQKKCLGKMDEVSRREGRTVLVVSHNMGVITSLCSKALWLDHGGLRQQGTPQTVAGQYLAHATPSNERYVRIDTIPRTGFVKDDRLRFTAVEWLTPLPLEHGEPVRIRLHFIARTRVFAVCPVVGFNNLEGSRVLTYHMGLQKGEILSEAGPGKHYVDLIIDALPLGPAIYHIDIGCRSGHLHTLDALQVNEVQVIPGPTTALTISEGHSGVRLEGKWLLSSMEPVTDCVTAVIQQRQPN